MLKDRGFKKRKILLIIVVVIVSFFLIAFFAHKVLTENRLTKFNIETQNLNCTDSSEITNVLNSLHLNYFNFNPENVENSLRKKFICIGKIEQTLSYPDKLKIIISGREPKFVVTSIHPNVEANPQIVLSLDQINATQSTTAAFPPKVLNEILDSYKNASESAYFLVDESGMVFEEASAAATLPKLSIFSEDIKVGRFVAGDAIKKTLAILEKLQEFNIGLDNMLIVGERFIIDSKPRIVFSLNRPPDRQAASLQLILRQAKMNLDPDSRDTRSVESVDLRFDRPVVVYSK